LLGKLSGRDNMKELRVSGKDGVEMRLGQRSFEDVKRMSFLNRRAFCDWSYEFEFRGSSKHPDHLLIEGLAPLRCAGRFITLMCSVKEQLIAISRTIPPTAAAVYELV
jgi:hypothetical protein